MQAVRAEVLNIESAIWASRGVVIASASYIFFLGQLPCYSNFGGNCDPSVKASI